jgi:hypothetical protein
MKEMKNNIMLIVHHNIMYHFLINGLKVSCKKNLKKIASDAP